MTTADGGTRWDSMLAQAEWHDVGHLHLRFRPQEGSLGREEGLAPGGINTELGEPRKGLGVARAGGPTVASSPPGVTGPRGGMQPGAVSDATTGPPVRELSPGEGCGAVYTGVRLWRGSSWEAPPNLRCVRAQLCLLTWPAAPSRSRGHRLCRQEEAATSCAEGAGPSPGSGLDAETLVSHAHDGFGALTTPRLPTPPETPLTLQPHFREPPAHTRLGTRARGLGSSAGSLRSGDANAPCCRHFPSRVPTRP